MGISVVLESERHEPRARVDDTHFRLNRLLPTAGDFKCISFIDPYGMTVFNQLQMQVFLSEWATVREKAQLGEEREVVDAIRSLAEQCRDGVHLLLVFYGD